MSSDEAKPIFAWLEFELARDLGRKRFQVSLSFPGDIDVIVTLPELSQLDGRFVMNGTERALFSLFGVAAFGLPCPCDYLLRRYSAPASDKTQLSQINIQTLMQNPRDLTDSTPAVPY